MTFTLHYLVYAYFLQPSILQNYHSMKSENQRHSEIHTIHLNPKTSELSNSPHRPHKRASRQSIRIMDELADSKNKAYLEHLEQYYNELEKFMTKCTHKRVKSTMTEFIVFMINQLILTVLKYHFLHTFNNNSYTALIQIFSIISFLGGFYMVSIHILNFGLTSFLKIYFSLDKMLLLLLSITFINTSLIDSMSLANSSARSMQIFFPLWLFYSAGSVRIQVMYYKWNTPQILISKIVHLISFASVLLTGFNFIYKQSYKHLSSNNGDKLISCYCLAVCLFFIEYYRLFSKFDGTNDLRYEYYFQNDNQSEIRKKKKELQIKLQQWKIGK